MKSDMKKIQELAKIIGGKSYLIGGAVIDSILGNEIKDWDVEVYNLNLSDIESALKNNGLNADMVGASFGIIKTQYQELDIDLSIPRRENRIGKGHKGFEVEFDPCMTPKEAGLRRDLTINSMYMDIETSEIVDTFGGMEDLKNGVIRATNSDTFVEDPLRVMRIMQLLPRKGKTVDSSTVELCRSIVDEFSSLPKERIFEEFVKLLTKASKPSMGLDFLKNSGWIAHFPELENLIGCEQNPEWHPEGDVWNHTLAVIDYAASLRDLLPKEWQLAYMFGCLLHDVGKVVVTTSDLTSNGHDTAGGPLAYAFMTRLTNNTQLIDRVVSIVVNHMACGQLAMQGSKIAAYKRLHNRLRLDVAAMVSKADSCSRYVDSATAIEHLPSKLAMQYFSEFGAETIKPVLMGRHLIEVGLKPGIQFKQLLNEAYELQIEYNINEPFVLLQMVLKETKTC